MKTICIMCPVGCELEIDETQKTVSGNLCPRGETYGKDEISNPKRIVTSVVKTWFGTLSVKTTISIPKEKIFEVLKEIAKIDEKNEKISKKTVKIGDILIKNVLNLNSDIVVTGINFVDLEDK